MGTAQIYQINAYRNGCKFDSWTECFDLEKWLDAFKKANLTAEFFANKKYSYDEILGWDHLDYAVSKQFLINENKKAKKAKTTMNCREKCAGCGANCYGEGVCFEKR